MYIDYETYVSLGGSVSEEEFPSSEAWAEVQLNAWTLNRLKSVNWDAWKTEVELVMTRLIDKKTEVLEADGNAPISHFSNGQDSYTFSVGEPVLNVVLGAIYGYAIDVLPVELMSACVHYNGAN